MKLKITETFSSIQGEGRRVGAPSFFIRTFGCNLSCPGFGQPDLNNLIPIEEMPHNQFDASQIKDINELPVFPIGCDSSAAWNKKYVHLARDMTPEELVEEFLESRMREIVITGGEPLLKKAPKFWVEFLRELDNESYIDFPITFETNGTQKLIPELHEMLENIPVIFSVSPKLSNSGEPKEKAWNIDAIDSYLDCVDINRYKKSEVYLKFVIRNEDQIPEVLEFVRMFDEELIPDDSVFLMPEGGTLEGLSLTEREVAQLAMTHGFMYSPRLHINLYGNTWGT